MVKKQAALAGDVGFGSQYPHGGSHPSITSVHGF